MTALYSYSRLQLYSNCPKAFYYKYVLELAEPPNEALVLGKTVHTAIEKYLKQKQRGDKGNMSVCVQEALGEATIPIDHDTALKLCLNPAITENTFLYDLESAQIEHHFHIPLDNEGRIVLQGTLDYLEIIPDNTAYLLDWKTNHVKYGADNRQLSLYAWYLKEHFGVDRVFGRLAFLRYNVSSCLEQTVFEADKMEEARRWAYTTANDIEGVLAERELFGGDDAQYFPAKPNAKCQYCGYAYQCSKAIDLRPILVNCQEQALQVAENVLRLEAAVTAMKEQLKAWVKETNKPVRIEGGEFRFVPSTTWNFGSEGLQCLCDRITSEGLDCWQYLTVGATQLKKLDLPDSELKLYGTKKISEAFRFMKSTSEKTKTAHGEDGQDENRKASGGRGRVKKDPGTAA